MITLARLVAIGLVPALLTAQDIRDSAGVRIARYNVSVSQTDREFVETDAMRGPSRGVRRRGDERVGVYRLVRRRVP